MRPDIIVNHIKALKPKATDTHWPGLRAEIKLDGFRLCLWVHGGVPYAHGRLARRDYCAEFPSLREFVLKNIPNGYAVDGEVHAGTRSSDTVTALNEGSFQFHGWSVYRTHGGVLAPVSSNSFRAHDSMLEEIGINVVPLYDSDLHPDRNPEFSAEGVVYKEYPCARWKKWKPFKTADLRVVDYFEGNGHRRGTLGGVITKRCRVATGWTDHERQDLWTVRHTLIGRMMEVKYDSIDNKGGLRFPVFQRWRTDKEEESL